MVSVTVTAVACVIGGIAAVLVTGWAATLVYVYVVRLRRYDRLLESSGKTLAELVAGGVRENGAVLDAVTTAVRYNPFAFLVSNYDDAVDVGHRLAGMNCRLLYWHRYNPTFMLCLHPVTGDLIMAIRGTETAADAAANRDVVGRTARGRDGLRVTVHRGVQRLVRAHLSGGGPWASPEFRAAVREGTANGAARRLILVGYSLGGSLAVALAALLRNPARLGAAFDLPPADVSALGDLLGGIPVRCVAYNCPTVFRFDGADAAALPDLRDILTVVKEGDAVPLLSLANITAAGGVPALPAAQTLRHTGPVLVVSDERWRGRDIDWLEKEENRAPRSPLRLFYIPATVDAATERSLLGPEALIRAAPVAFRGFELVRPLHAHGRWRRTMDAVAFEATATGYVLPQTPPAAL